MILRSTLDNLVFHIIYIQTESSKNDIPQFYPLYISVKYIFKGLLHVWVVSNCPLLKKLWSVLTGQSRSFGSWYFCCCYFCSCFYHESYSGRISNSNLNTTQQQYSTLISLFRPWPVLLNEKLNEKLNVALITQPE